jgi:hypothetical protein
MNRLLGIFALIATQACGSSSSTPDASHAAQVMAACMHICTCEAGVAGTPGTTDTMCQADCAGSLGPWNTSTSTGTSTSLPPKGTSFSTTAGGVDFAASEQACVDCFNAASCSDIANGAACTTACQ